MLNKKKILFYLRLCLGLALIAFVLTKINPNAFITLWRSLNLNYLIFAFFISIFDRVIVTYRWKILLESKGVNFPLFILLEISLVGQFIGRFLPSSLAPDAIKIYSLSKHIPNRTESLSSVIVDRFAGFLALLIMALCAIEIFSNFYYDSSPAILNLELILILLFLTSCFVILGNKVIHKIFLSFKFLNKYHWGKIILEFYESIYNYREHKMVFLKTLIISFFVQVFRSIFVYIVSLALNLDVSIIYFFIFIPAITIILMLPITLGGIGVAEMAYIYFFSHAGLSVDAALSLSMLCRILSILVTLPGGVIYALKGITVIGNDTIKEKPA
ncbi:MAG: lysylphosphatidylglycerol synthase transmembrane domain-containing protein [Candidatus Hodarchaeota archaeon]